MAPDEVLAKHTSYMRMIRVQEWQAWFILRDEDERLATSSAEQQGKVASARRR